MVTTFVSLLLENIEKLLNYNHGFQGNLYIWLMAGWKWETTIEVIGER